MKSSQAQCGPYKTERTISMKDVVIWSAAVFGIAILGYLFWRWWSARMLEAELRRNPALRAKLEEMNRRTKELKDKGDASVEKIRRGMKDLKVSLERTEKEVHGMIDTGLAERGISREEFEEFKRRDSSK